MNLDLTETQELLRDTIRGYLEKEVPFDRVRELEKNDDWDDGLWKGLCEQGWLGLLANQNEEGSLIEAGLMFEEFARRAAIVPLLEVGVSLRVLPADLVDAVLGGSCVPVPALEGGTVSVQSGKLSGEKRFVDYGQYATHHVVAAEDGLYLVPREQPGVSTQPLRSIGRTPTCIARYNDAAATHIAEPDKVADLERHGRALAAAQIVGGLQQALDMTVAYACIRKQFDKPIGSFQAVRHHSANMAIRLASARLLTYEALSALAHPDLHSTAILDERVALAKASASLAAPEVSMLAHQIHGGNGIIEENDLYFFTLRAKERSLAWGTAAECLENVTHNIEDPSEWL